jgi:hypothetical protein
MKFAELFRRNVERLRPVSWVGSFVVAVTLVTGCGVVRYPEDGGASSDSPAGSQLDSIVIPDGSVWPDHSLVADRGPKPDQSVGAWFQVDGNYCPDFCSDMGLTNVPSPEGARCMSGEVIPASGVAAKISFLYGCYPPSCPITPAPIHSYSDMYWCYEPYDYRDDYDTNVTVGCFCR